MAYCHLANLQQATTASILFCFEVAHGGRQPDGYGFFKSGGPHASSPSHNLLPRLVSASARIQQEDSAGTTRQDRREEVKLQQASIIFFLIATKESARKGGLTASASVLPKTQPRPGAPRNRPDSHSGMRRLIPPALQRHSKPIKKHAPKHG